MSNTTLKLILKKKWFDLISSGIKLEEYREITPYYLNRLLTDAWGHKIDEKFVTDKHFLNKLKLSLNNLANGDDTSWLEPKHSSVTFYLGYASDRKSMTMDIESITIGEGKEEWGAEKGKEYFVIKLKEE